MKTRTRDLRTEAESIIRDMRLLEALRPHGDARVVGSVALDLVVKPDIDLHLLTEADDLFTVANAVYRLLLDWANVKHVRISDYRDRGGLKVGIDSYPGQLADWSIDLWITNDPETTGFALVDRLSREMTEECRRAILDIKKTLHSRSQLQDGMSARVYSAVVDEGVRSIAEFDKYMEG